MISTGEKINSQISSIAIAELFWTAQQQGGVISKKNILNSNINPMAIDKLLENGTLNKIYDKLDLFEFSLSLGNKYTKLFSACLLTDQSFITGYSVLAHYNLINIELDSIELGVLNAEIDELKKTLPSFIDLVAYEDEEIFDEVENIKINDIDIPMLKLSSAIKQLMLEGANTPTLGSAFVHALMQGYITIAEYKDLKNFIEDIEQVSMYEEYLDIADEIVDSLKRLNRAIAF